ncbi:lipolytic enzyme [Zymoseptoria tritici IPO323]|uniref:Lipolytic enzyme n=1 Tax=Zymoseptoria tritici (strain CBS 115943 / IPO323) TaxID=336722 RepID=F9XPX0_ZYMTI|nr:lipolytic enzyme [Zymoseptoria tritici IPO323]EGP82541.1 lipolytic enzyme [Zymoseptoria tritici IPO323]
MSNAFSHAFPFDSIWSLRNSIVYGDHVPPNPPHGHWVDTWTAMPQLTEPGNLPPPPYNGTTTIFSNSTIRQTIRTTTQATTFRIRLSNAFGLTPLPITAMTVALPLALDRSQNLTGSPYINTTSLIPLTFSHASNIILPPGSLAVSDPITFPHSLPANSILSLTLYLATGQSGGAITSHPGSRTESFLSLGDLTHSANLTSPSAISLFHWYFISAVEAWSPHSTSALAILGDSITDGRGSFLNANNRWPDLLSSRLQAPSSKQKDIAILNQAAGGNRLLADGLGPSGLERIERDILSHSGVKYALVFLGVNDIGTAPSTTAAQTAVGDAIIHGYQQVITRIHAHGVPVWGGTITPFGCANQTLQPYSTGEREVTRVRVNNWIRDSVGKLGGFDGLIDFDEVVRDGKNQTRLLGRYDSGDCLHLNPDGYAAMARGFPLGLFEQFKGGVDGFV